MIVSLVEMRRPEESGTAKVGPLSSSLTTAILHLQTSRIKDSEVPLVCTYSLYLVLCTQYIHSRYFIL